MAVFVIAIKEFLYLLWIFFVDLLADLPGIKLFSENSVKCSFTINNKTDPWLLRY